MQMLVPLHFHEKKREFYNKHLIYKQIDLIKPIYSYHQYDPTYFYIKNLSIIINMIELERLNIKGQTAKAE